MSKRFFTHIERRDTLVNQGILRRDKLDNLVIYTYVNNCKTWTEDTINSRGIILDSKTGEVVAQPFPKFFNMNERRETQERNLPWDDDFQIFLKEDGWLGILYRHDGQHKIATRGSFRSEGAVWATQFLQDNFNLSSLPDEITLIFEIISPITKIVVDYGNKEDLVLLAAYNRLTGEEYDREYVAQIADQFGFTLVRSWDKNYFGWCRGTLKQTPGNELEGFVIRFSDGLRVKIKSEDYFRRAKIRQGLTPLGIWREMVRGRIPETFWKIVDTEFHDEANSIYLPLKRKYNQTEDEIYSDFAQIKDASNRQAFASLAKRTKYPSAMFSLLDNKYDSIDSLIMKLIRPKNNRIQE